MFVDDKTFVVYKTWPTGLIQGTRKSVPFPTRHSCTFSSDVRIDNSYSSVVLSNPTFVQLLKMCVHIKRVQWKGKIILLFECDNKPPPFRLVNDN
ncbi:m105L [Myxoma virus]|nr:m105L [Myxoma virus]